MARASRASRLSETEAAKNNAKWASYYSEACLEVVFLMTRFREYLNLPEFTHIEFEEELLKEESNYIPHYNDVYRSLLLTQIVDSLLRIPENAKTNQSEEVIVNFSKRHLRKNPFGESTSCDFHLLPTNVKLWILQEIVKYYCELENAQNVDNWRSANELRVKTFGPCSNKDELYFFHDFRLFKKHPSSEFASRMPALDVETVDNATWKEMYYEILRGNQYECIANTEDTWSAFIKQLEKNRNAADKKTAEELKTVFATFKDDFDELFNRYNSQKNMRQRKTQKMEVELRRSLGLCRTSARLRSKQTEAQSNNSFDDDDESSLRSSRSISKDKEPRGMSREERFLRREEMKYTNLVANSDESTVTSPEKTITTNGAHSNEEAEEKDIKVEETFEKTREISPVQTLLEKTQTPPPRMSNVVNAPAEEVVKIEEIKKETEEKVEVKNEETNESLGNVVQNETKEKSTALNDIPNTNGKKEADEDASDLNEEAQSTSRCNPIAVNMMKKSPNAVPKTSPITPTTRTPTVTFDPNVSVKRHILDQISPMESTVPKITPADTPFPRLNWNNLKPKRPRSYSGSSAGANITLTGASSGIIASESPKKRVKFELDSSTHVNQFRIDTKKVRTAIRLYSREYTTYYKKWSNNYNIRSMPKELEAFFTAMPIDDSLVTMAEWAQIKNIIFRTPMKLGGVEGINIVDKGPEYRDLACVLLTYNKTAWPLVFGVLSDEDKAYIRKTEECIEKIERIQNAESLRPTF